MKLVARRPAVKTPHIGAAFENAGEPPHAASVFSTSLIQYEVPNTSASSLKL